MKVSVVVTALNEEGSIRKLLLALVGQTRSADEIIIVDGGSTDRTMSNLKCPRPRQAKPSTVRNLAKRGGQMSKLHVKNLKIFVKAGNRSVGRNYGISKAKNEIIAVTDAGGYPKKDWLEKIIAPFKDNNVDVVGGYYKSLAKTSFERCVTPYFLVMPDRVWRGMEFLPSSRSVAFRKKIWERAGGYPEKFSHNEDFVFAHNLKKAGARMFFEPDALVYWQPPKNPAEAARKFFRFALGDVEAHLARPKIKFIFVRYATGLVLLLLGYNLLLFIFILFYLIWSWQKNFKYAKVWQSVFWLPLIQIVADLSIMCGFTVGSLRR